jgi:hypothetical protein
MENTDTQNIPVENIAEGKIDNRTKKGFTIIGWGALVLLSGCIGTMIMSTENPLYEFVLYGPTSVGASMVLYGFYCVFE